MSQIIPCYSGCVDLDEDFGDWKEYSAFCLFLLPEKPDTVIRHKQCPNAGKSTKENMGGRKGAWGCRSLTYWDSYASAFIVCQSPASPHSLRSTGARERPRWFSCDSGGQERLYQHKVHLVPAGTRNGVPQICLFWRQQGLLQWVDKLIYFISF